MEILLQIPYVLSQFSFLSRSLLIRQLHIINISVFHFIVYSPAVNILFVRVLNPYCLSGHSFDLALFIMSSLVRDWED